MENLKNCDICGSSNLVTVERQMPLNVPFESSATYTQVLIVCENCGEEIDVTDEATTRTELANIEKRSIEALIDAIANLGFSYAHVERALDLPARTISRWKSGQDPSAAGLTLLRFLRTYPWLISVAEKNFDENFSRQAIFSAVADEMGKINQVFSKKSDCYAWAMVQQVKTDDISTSFVVGGYSNATTNSNNTLIMTV
jgi:hypothetical protein